MVHSLSTEFDICQLIKADTWRMDMLRLARSLNLADWAIGAGFVRAAVWDALTDKATVTPLPDLDLLYFDPAIIDRDHELTLLETINQRSSHDLWDVKNQARMHIRNDDPPYRDTMEAVANWLETPTCVAVRLEHGDTLTLLAPLGIDDLLALRVRPAPAAMRKPHQYKERMQAKDWPALWPGLVVEEC